MAWQDVVYTSEVHLKAALLWGGQEKHRGQGLRPRQDTANSWGGLLLRGLCCRGSRTSRWGVNMPVGNLAQRRLDEARPAFSSVVYVLSHVSVVCFLTARIHGQPLVRAVVALLNVALVGYGAAVAFCSDVQGRLVLLQGEGPVDVHEGVLPLVHGDLYWELGMLLYRRGREGAMRPGEAGEKPGILELATPLEHTLLVGLAASSALYMGVLLSIRTARSLSAAGTAR